MNRDEILKKAQAGKIGMDEREQQVLGLSFGIGGILMALLCVILAILRLVNGQDAYDYASIVFLYLAGTELHLYWKTRRRGLGAAGRRLRPGVRGATWPCFCWGERHGRSADFEKPVEGGPGGEGAIPDPAGGTGGRVPEHHQLH